MYQSLGGNEVIVERERRVAVSKIEVALQRGHSVSS